MVLGVRFVSFLVFENFPGIPQSLSVREADGERIGGRCGMLAAYVKRVFIGV